MFTSLEATSAFQYTERKLHISGLNYSELACTYYSHPLPVGNISATSMASTIVVFFLQFHPLKCRLTFTLDRLTSEAYRYVVTCS